jgi:hypothetical protein
MAVFLSPVGGVAAQFFTNTGVILSGGKLYTYAAGTTTPLATYTTYSGGTARTNPIVLDSAGRVPDGGEIWLTGGVNYKFLLKDSNNILIATYDNVTGINDPTTFNAVLTAFEASLAASTGSSLVGYLPAGTNAVATTVQAKLRQLVSVKDFGAVGNGTTDDTFALTNAINTGLSLDFSNGTYLISGPLYPKSNTVWDGGNNGTIKYSTQTCLVDAQTITNWNFVGLTINGNYTAYTPASASYYPFGIRLESCSDIEISNSNFQYLYRIGVLIGHLSATSCSNVRVFSNTFTNIGKTTDPSPNFGNAIAVLNAHDVLIENNYINAVTGGGGSATAGIDLEPGDVAYNCYNITINNNNISNVLNAPGIQLYGSSGFTGDWSNISISNNSIIQTGTAEGIRCFLFGHTYISDNYLESTQGITVNNYKTYEATITGNDIRTVSTPVTIAGATPAAINVVNGIAAVNISSNMIRNVAGVGIYCSMYDTTVGMNLKGCLIQNNDLHDINSHGIMFSVGNFVISGNTMVNCSATNTSGYYINPIAGGIYRCINGYVGANTFVQGSYTISAVIRADGDLFDNTTFGANNFAGTGLTYSTVNLSGRTPGAYVSALPIGGTWKVGDVLNNIAPAASGNIGWVCTTAGAYPATAVFKAFGAIQA